MNSFGKLIINNLYQVILKGDLGNYTLILTKVMNCDQNNNLRVILLVHTFSRCTWAYVTIERDK